MKVCLDCKQKNEDSATECKNCGKTQFELAKDRGDSIFIDECAG